jgi:uncharacterized membrane protein YidH (DUF202 family)
MCLLCKSAKAISGIRKKRLGQHTPCSISPLNFVSSTSKTFAMEEYELQQDPTHIHGVDASSGDRTLDDQEEKIPPENIPLPKETFSEWLWGFWRRNVVMIIPGSCARDHLGEYYLTNETSVPLVPASQLTQTAASERTFLAYYRTSVILSLASVVIAQLQILQHSPHPSPTFGFYILGKPLAATFVISAIVVSLLGGVRWWRWQQSLIRGKAMTGGWELMAVGALVLTLVIVLFGLTVAVDVKLD